MGFIYVNPPDEGLLIPGFAKTLHDPQIVANGILLNDEVTYRLAWDACEGLAEPATLEPGQDFETLGGINHVEPGPDAYPARQIRLVGRVIGQADYATKFRQVAAIARAFVHRPVRLLWGTLALELDVTAFKIPRDLFKKLPDRVTWEIEGKATPGLWIGEYGFAAGTDQGVPCKDDRPDQAGYLASVEAGSANAMLVWTNQGDAPTRAAVLLSVGAAALYGRTVYLRNQDPRYQAQVPVNIDQYGIGRIFAEAGLLVGPGLNWIRVEDAGGNLVDGPIVASFHGTVFRYHGNSVDRRFSEGPILFNGFRRGSATYTRWDNKIVEAVDQEPRAGVAFGDYFPEKAGIICELASKNVVTNGYFGGFWNWNHATSSVNMSVGAVGTTDPLFFGGSALRVTVGAQAPVGAHAEAWQDYAGEAFTPGSYWTASALASTLIEAGLTGKLMLRALDGANNQLGVAEASIVLATEDQHLAATLLIPDGTVKLRTEIRVDVTQSGVIWGQWVDFGNVQTEPLPFATSYIPSPTDGPVLVRAADHVAIWAPQNYVDDPRDFGAWDVVTGSAPERTILVDASDGTKRLWRWPTTAGSKIRIEVAPDVIPGSTPWTGAVKLRGAGSPTVRVRLVDLATGAVFADDAFTVLGAYNSAADFQTVHATGTPQASCLGFYLELYRPSGGGDVYLEYARVTQGTFPGSQIPDAKGAVVRPRNVFEMLDSATQNMRLKMTVCLPPARTGTEYTVFGDWDTYDLCLMRLASTPADSNVFRLYRRTNGDIKAVDIDLGAVQDRGPHVLEFEQINVQDRLTGERGMYLNVYVDGVAKFQSPNYQTLLIWEWKRLERLCLANGVANVTARDLEFIPPALPSGTLPVS